MLASVTWTRHSSQSLFATHRAASGPGMDNRLMRVTFSVVGYRSFRVDRMSRAATALTARFEGLGLLDSSFSQRFHEGNWIHRIRQEVDASLDAFPLRNHAGGSGQHDSVDPVVAALLINDLNGQGQPASLRTPRLTNDHRGRQAEPQTLCPRTPPPEPSLWLSHVPRLRSRNCRTSRAQTQRFSRLHRSHQQCRK